MQIKNREKLQSDVCRLRNLHRMGSDIQGKGFDLSPRQYHLLQLAFNKTPVGYGFYLTYTYELGVKVFVLVDTAKGEVYKFSGVRYESIVKGNMLVVTDLKNKQSHTVLLDGFLNLNCIAMKKDYVFMSSPRYPALRIENEYCSSIRIHWLVILMDHEVEDVLRCSGNYRINEIHHKIPYKISKDNSRSNLELLSVKKHKDKHKKMMELGALALMMIGG